MPLAFGNGMKRTFLLTISVLLLSAAPMSAQQRGGSPKPKTPHAAPAPKVKTHVASPPRASTIRGGSAVKAGKTPRGGGHASSKTTAGASSVKPTKTAKASKTTATAPVGSATTLSPVQLKLQKNTNLASKLQSRLPAGTNLTLAASGFRNLGQFVAAVNVSNNLGIPFAELKTRMVDQGMSLGQAIQDARPRTTDTSVVARRAETDADALIRTTDQTTTTKSKKVKNTYGAKQ
jgi:hypothetical protein